MNETKKKILWFVAIFTLASLMVSVASYNILFSMQPMKTSEQTTVESIPLNEDTLIILFTHAGDDAEGKPVEKQIFIQESIKKGDIPVYDDKEQVISITCKNNILLENAEIALKSMGYTNITRMD